MASEKHTPFRRSFTPGAHEGALALGAGSRGGFERATPRLRTQAVFTCGCFLFAALLPARGANALDKGPVLLFTDLGSGPASGGQDGLGAFITLYGEGFGAQRGASSVSVGGTEVARYVSWGENNAVARGLDRIVVQPGPNAVSGNIVVTIAGKSSNPLPFTVRAGNVYFVNPLRGDDANPGTYAQPWATLWRPRQTLVAGDIVYLEGGTFSQMDPEAPGWDTLLFLERSFAASGTASAPIAYVGYPGNPPLLANPAARRGVYLNQDGGPLSYYVIGNIRFAAVRESLLVTGVGQSIVANDLSNGGEGDKVGIFGNTSVIKILGNRLDSNGTPTTKFYSIYVQGFGVNRDIDVGWNEVRNQEGRSIQVYGHLAGDIVDDLRIHDNVIVGSELNNILLGGSDGGTEILGTVRVTGNVIAGSRSTEGLRVNDPQGTVIIENNTFHGNAVAQVYLEEAGAGRVTLRNNIIVAQAGQQYYEFDAGQAAPSSIVPSNNLAFGAGPCMAWDTGCINQDPAFAGASDYHLQASSPAIDAGVTTSAVRDHDGVPRPQGAAYDIGAYEYFSGYVPVACTPGANVLCIDGSRAGDRRFQIEIDWQTVQGGGQGGRGTAISMAPIGFSSGGIFWFFDATNPEMLVKVITGCGVNGRFWVFASAGTNVGLTTRVTDTSTGALKTYVNADLTPALPVQDVDAFPCN